MRTVKRCNVRLSDGRTAILDTCELFPGEFETMLLDSKTEEEITSATAKTEAEALRDFSRIRTRYNVPELSGRYAALASALESAKESGLEAGESLGNDWGTCNFDAPAVVLPRWSQKMVEAAAKKAGIGCFKWREMGAGCYVFPLRFGYQGNANTAAAEAAAESLKAAGYEAFVYYQMD